MANPNMTMVVCLVCGCGALTVSAGTVDVTTAAAHDDTYGMVVSVDGKNDRAYVEDHHPAGEKIYSVDFWFHPGDLVLAAKTAHVIFQGVGANPDGGSGDARIFEIELKMLSKNRLTIRAISYSDDQSRVRKVASGAIRIDEHGWNHVLLEWTAASTNNSPDGFTRLSLVGGSRAGGIVEIVGRVPDQRLAVDKVRMGAVVGVDATTFGSCHFDTFASYRTIQAQ
jgi:hypothetical protein